MKKGFSIVEIIVAAAIIAVVVTAAAGAWQLYLKTVNQTTGLTAASLLADEGDEAMFLLRDKGWTANISRLALNTPYYLYWNGNAYATSTSPVVIAGSYVRTVTLKAVSRDGTTFNISGSGTVDPNTLDAIVAVSYASSSQPLATSEILLHNVFNN